MYLMRYSCKRFSDISRFTTIITKHSSTCLIRRQPLNYANRTPEQYVTNCHPIQKRCLFSTVQTDIKKQVELIGEKFKDSLELLEDAKSSFGTVYFSEDMREAEALIEETLSDFRHLLNKLNEDQKREVRKIIELKMNELKAQLQILKENAKNTLN